MKFSSEAKRQLHPEARLIPISVWEDSFMSYEGGYLTKAMISLMQKTDIELQTCINTHHFESYELIYCWFAIAYSHPNMSDEQLMQITQELGMPERTILEAVLTLGRVSILETYFPYFQISSWMFSAATKGGLSVIKWLALRPENYPRHVFWLNDYSSEHNDGYFISAVRIGDIDIIEHFISLAPQQASSRTNLSSSLIEAAKHGHLNIFERLLELAADPHELMQGHWGGFSSDSLGGIVFDAAASYSHRNLAIRLLNFSSAFAYAEENQHLYAKYTTPIIIDMLASLHRKNTEVEALNPNAVFNIEDAEEAKFCFYILRNLIRRNDRRHLDEMRFLLDIPSVKALAHQASGFPDIFNYNHISLLYVAVDVGNHKAAELLLTIPAVVEQLPQINWRNEYWLFDKSARSGNRNIINRFLNISTVLAYAEMHRHEYARYTDPFIVHKLASLHGRKTDVEALNPQAVFNIEDAEEAKLCFYILRNIIRRNEPRLLDEMRFLLEIPSVKALAHQAVTPGVPNELLRLAVTIGNRTAATILLNIPSVRLLSQQHEHYIDEARGGLNLATLAQDRESSMHALSVGEQRRLKRATALYESQIKSLHVPIIIASLRTKLQERFIANPAIIARNDGSTLTLPMDWAAFQALGLSELKLKHQAFSEKEQALQAYYQHKDHTAYRYLSHPNPWMHCRAFYVEVNPDNRAERWSTFEEYQPLIAMLFLAAKDEKTPPCDGFTLETRLEHFIDELAQIGRAHNWDDTRMKLDAEDNLIVDEDGNPITEEYDNLEGDKPSCYSGVKRRLFQSVLGHPLLKMLTKEVVNEELRDFVRQHFADSINESNRDALKKEWDALLLGEATGAYVKLISLNISERKQAKFIQLLKNKYDSQFNDDKSLLLHVKKAFALNTKDKTAMHASQFGYVGLDQLLESTSTSSVSEQALHSDLISSNFFLKVMCSTTLKVIAGLLLTAGIIAIILGTCGIFALPLVPTVVIGATTAALGAGLLIGGFFGGRPKHKPDEANQHLIDTASPKCV